MLDPQVWVVRAGVNNEIAGEVEKASVVAIGWSEMGDPTELGSRDEFTDTWHYIWNEII